MTPWRPLNIVVGLSFLHNLDTMYNSKDSALLLVDFHCAPSLSDAGSSLSSARQAESIIFLISQLFLMRLLPCIMVVGRLQLGSIGEGVGGGSARTRCHHLIVFCRHLVALLLVCAPVECTRIGSCAVALALNGRLHFNRWSSQEWRHCCL